MAARFLVNLRASTMKPDFTDRLHPAGFLAAPAYLTRATTAYATALSSRRLLMVDNGLFDDLGRLTAGFADEADTLLGSLTTDTGATISASEALARSLSPTARVLVMDLARRVARAADSAGSGMTLDGQLALRPTAVIGTEDITAACLLRLGLDVDLVPGARALLRRRNTAVANTAAKVAVAPTRRNQPARHHAVAGAHDYDTAYDAGQTFARAGLQHAAIGFGAFMADDTYTTDYKIRGRRYRLDRPLPQRYLRTALVARGFWDGWATVDGAPNAFHFLGLGAPIMVGLVALAGHATSNLTFDATSPIRDAVEGTLYLIDPAPLKTRTRRVATLLMDEPGYRWRCRCPFCATYLREHPFDRSAAAAWRTQYPTRVVTAADLRPPAPLARAFPLLAEPNGGPTRAAVDTARIGHNHWTLQRLTNQITANATTREALADWLDGIVTAYEQTTNANTFAAAVRTAYTISRDGH